MTIYIRHVSHNLHAVNYMINQVVSVTWEAYTQFSSSENRKQ